MPIKKGTPPPSRAAGSGLSGGIPREEQEAQALEDLKRRLREERAELALPLAERARKVELRQRMFEELVG